eukprot:2055832-Pyramimonas_sp.AAC.1
MGYEPCGRFRGISGASAHFPQIPPRTSLQGYPEKLITITHRLPKRPYTRSPGTAEEEATRQWICEYSATGA